LRSRLAAEEGLTLLLAPSNEEFRSNPSVCGEAACSLRDVLHGYRYLNTQCTLARVLLYAQSDYVRFAVFI
jgi:hypothetical protein